MLLMLALSPGLFFSLNVVKGMKETDARTDEHALSLCILVADEGSIVALSSKLV